MTKMNTKPFFLLCLLYALFIISVVAARPATDQPSKDGTQANVVAEESKSNPELDSWGGGQYGGGGHYGGGGWGGYGGRHGKGWGGGGGGHGTQDNVVVEESKPNPELDHWGGGHYGGGGHHGGGWGGHGGGHGKGWGGGGGGHGTQANVVAEESKPKPELDRWGGGSYGGRGHHGGGGHYGGGCKCCGHRGCKCC